MRCGDMLLFMVRLSSSPEVKARLDRFETLRTAIEEVVESVIALTVTLQGSSR